nr:fumarylacetoacetate hydrolase family protein [Sphingomonas sp. AP4-R1]
MTFVVPPLETVTVPVASSTDLFPVRRIFCVGRNYSDHVKEMGGDPERNPPFFFSKPADAIVPSGATVRYPTLTKEFHYEIELVVAIGKPAFQISPEEANNHIYGYAVGIDLTRRDIQMAALKAGLPWDFGKAFDESAPCAPIHPISQTGVIEDARIWLKVNGETKQDARTADLIWSVPELLSTLSHGIALKPGDLVYTGTPAGVAAIVTGDRIEGGVEGLGDIEITIGAGY